MAVWKSTSLAAAFAPSRIRSLGGVCGIARAFAFGRRCRMGAESKWARTHLMASGDRVRERKDPASAAGSAPTAPSDDRLLPTRSLQPAVVALVSASRASLRAPATFAPASSSFFSGGATRPPSDRQATARVNRRTLRLSGESHFVPHRSRAGAHRSGNGRGIGTSGGGAPRRPTRMSGQTSATRTRMLRWGRIGLGFWGFGVGLATIVCL